MEIPNGNFFQVTINSQKLLSYINQLSLQLKDQQTKLEQFKTFANGFENQMSRKINQKFSDFNIEWERRHKTNSQNINHLKMYMKDHDKKTDKRFTQFEEMVNVTNNRITRVKDNIEEETCIKLSFFQKKLENNVTAQEFQNLKQQLGNVNCELIKMAQNKQGVEYKLDQQLKKIDELKKQLLTSKVSKKQKSTHRLKIIDVVGEDEEDITRKRTKTTQRNGAIIDQPHQIQLFVNKIQELEAKVNKKGNKQNQRSHEGRGKELSQIILEKLDMLSAQYTQKVVDIEDRLYKVCNRYEILNQQVGILNRKIDKYKNQQLQSKDILKHLEEKNIDEKEFDLIKNNIKLIAKQLQQSISTKLDRDTYENDIGKIKDKIALAYNISGEKCQKSQVKRIFTFLQSKIKQIIIILAQEKNFTKDGAAKRLPVKCLSCDKDLDPNQTIQGPPSHTLGHRSVRSSLGPNSSSRICHSYLKKRGKFLNNSSINED